jgi:hypothetical protein
MVVPRKMTLPEVGVSGPRTSDSIVRSYNFVEDPPMMVRNIAC